MPVTADFDLPAALEVVRRYFPATPLLPAPRLSEQSGAEVYLKLECCTPLRTFKIRGALNMLQALPAAARAHGVCTASAGNHGMAVAYAAYVHRLPATVFVPVGANPQKVAAIQRHGATVVVGGHDYQAAFEACQAHAAEHGLTLVHAYDDPAIIAGQGTVGLELLVQAPDVADVYVGIGGGGLIGGIAAAMKPARPDVRIVGVSPAGADALPRSVAAGHVVELERVATFADGLSARRPGVQTLALAQQYVDEFVRVADDDIWAAMEALLVHEGVVAEPAGAAAVAALRQKPPRSGKAVVVISGANIAPGVASELFRRAGNSRAS